MLSGRFLVCTMASLILNHHCWTWRHAKRLLEASYLTKHLIGCLGVRIKLLSNRVDRFRQWLDIWLKVSLTFYSWCWYFRSLWYRGCRSPVLSRAKHFLFKSLLLCLHLFRLFLSHQILLHAWSTLAHIKVCHLITLYPRICLRTKRGILLPYSFCFSSLLHRLQF